MAGNGLPVLLVHVPERLSRDARIEWVASLGRQLAGTTLAGARVLVMDGGSTAEVVTGSAAPAAPTAVVCAGCRYYGGPARVPFCRRGVLVVGASRAAEDARTFGCPLFEPKFAPPSAAVASGFGAPVCVVDGGVMTPETGRFFRRVWVSEELLADAPALDAVARSIAPDGAQLVAVTPGSAIDAAGLRDAWVSWRMPAPDPRPPVEG